MRTFKFSVPAVLSIIVIAGIATYLLVSVFKVQNRLDDMMLSDDGMMMEEHTEEAAE